MRSTQALSLAFVLTATVLAAGCNKRDDVPPADTPVTTPSTTMPDPAPTTPTTPPMDAASAPMDAASMPMDAASAMPGMPADSASPASAP